MKLRKIEFEGIRAFSDKTVFHFGQESGLYFLQGGTNEQDPELGSNGVGKSTIWSVLCWILFGKTPEGLRAGDLKSWQSEAKGYRGKLWIGRSVIERSWKPNKLTLDGKIVTEDQLQDFIGISFDTFTTTVLISQGAPMFFDMSAVKKLSMFTSLLQLDEWIEFSDEAKSRAASIEFMILAKDVGIARTEGNLDGLGISELREKKENFKSERWQEMAAFQAELKEMKGDLKVLTKRKAKGKRFRKKLAVQQEVLQKTLKKLGDELTETKVNCSAAMMLLNNNDTARQALKDQAYHFKTHKGKNCVSCGQVISVGTAKKQIRELDKIIKMADKEIRNSARKVKVLSIQEGSIEKEIQETNLAYRKLTRRQSSLEFKYEDLEEDHAKMQLAVEVIAAKTQRVYDTKNPFAPLLKDKLGQEDELIKTLKRRVRIRDRLMAEKDLVQYWIKGFKEVRLYLIEESLKQLEVETNRALAELGFSSEWRIKYSVERSSQAGRSMVGFNVSVRSPFSDGHVPFSAWSGGEKQRLRIAGSMGFMSLVSARTGLDLGIEVYDEPTQHLSPQGIDSLLEALRSRAQETGKRIWLVDHHTLDYGEFNSTAIVSKDVNGCSTIQAV